jgi:hypothetical protein
MPPEIKRFYKLEQEYRVLIRQIAKTMNVADLVQLKTHRNNIVVEARDLVRRLNIPDSNWCGTRQELS